VPLNKFVCLVCSLAAALAPLTAWSAADELASSTEKIAIVLPSDELRASVNAQPSAVAPVPAQTAPSAAVTTAAAAAEPAASSAVDSTSLLSPAATGEQQPAEIRPTLTPDTSLTQTDLWQRIRDGFDLPELDSKLVARHERWYADRPEYVANMMERAQRYLHYIVEEVEKRGMPTEIALLPMIESAFNPDAYSVSHASGIWQFIPSTGKKYGMKQNWWYDGRRDIISATEGALDYLQNLHDQFGDWELALAAYNCGEGAVARAIERNRRRGKPTDFASLKLPDQTRNYVPKLLAIKHIVSDPDKFGLQLQPIPNQPYFSAVATTHHIDAKLAAKLADIPLDEFNALNPGHNRPVILQENADILLLPVDKTETFRANLDSYNEPLVSWQPYASKKGERLDKLAPRFGLSVAKLKSVNGLSPRSKVSNGQTLLVPSSNGAEADADFEAFNTHILPDDQRTTVHIVRRGETLGSIARHYHISLASLKARNGNSSVIRPGQRLAIAGAAPVHAKTHLARAVRHVRSHLRQARNSGKSLAGRVAMESLSRLNSKDD
jgi:membrane-bound lytic murein transglycosylase D